MNVWTDGETHVVLGREGLSVHGEAWADRVLDQSQLALGPSRWAHKEVLGVSRDGRVALVLDGERHAVKAPLDGSAPPEILTTRILEARAIDDDRWAFVHIARVKGRDIARFAIGALPGDGKPSFVVDLDPARPNRVDWPSGLLFGEAPAPFSRARCGMEPSRLRLDVNRFGIALADADTGTVAIHRPGARTFEGVHRLPATATSITHASCTERGFVVGLRMEGSAGALLRFDRLGRPVMWADKTELGAMHVLDDGRLAYVAEGARELRIADAETLQDVESHDFGGDVGKGVQLVGGATTLAVDAEGTTFVVGLGDCVVVGRRPKRGGGLSFDALEPPTGRAKSEPPLAPEEARASRPKLELERVKGPAQLSLDPVHPAEEWSFRAGAAFEIEVPVISTGGEAQGLYVELAGDAIDRGLIEATAIEAEGVEIVTSLLTVTVNGSRRPRSEIPGLSIPASIVLPAVKKAVDRFAAATTDMFLRVRVRGQAKSAGRGLLTVRVGFLENGTTGSLMRGKSIEVHA